MSWDTPLANHGHFPIAQKAFALMATVVFTSIGTALGGSIGGALGALIGQSIDQGLFGTGMRKGPRLGDLAVQTSSYGSPIPRVFGAMRVAGTVIWASDLIEKEAIEGGGKGSPERTVYSYSANLAVALSARPIKDIGRIWADGKLIRGVNGNFKVKTKFRLSTGSEDQPADPLIASLEGATTTPAYRGLAMAIFEDLELAEFGNRIPLLTFEVIADQGPVPIAAIMSDASRGLIESEDTQAVIGFAAHGTSIKDSLSTLIEMSGVRLVEHFWTVRSPAAAEPLLLSADELGCNFERLDQSRLTHDRAPDASLPATLTLTYYDRDRDYQTGQARASSGKGGQREARVELPAVLTAGEARRLAEQALSRMWLAGETHQMRLPPIRMGIRPGDAVHLDGAKRPWMARSVAIEGMVVLLEAEAAPVDIPPLPADPGRPSSQPDLLVGRSTLALFELPPDGDALHQQLRAFVAASNVGQWKAPPVTLDLGSQPLPSIAINRRGALGFTETALHSRCPLLADDISDVVVRMVDEKHLLLNADADALMAGANLALVGEELIQFGRADQLSAGQFKLSKLLRGRRGTEWAAPFHSAEETFCLIEPGRLQQVPLAAGSIGAMLTAVAHGIGDLAPLPQASQQITGEAVRPPSPCHLEAVREGSGFVLRWVRRTYRYWSWLDGASDGPDTFPDRYRIVASGPAGETTIETTDPWLVLSQDQLPAQAGQPVSISVTTLGPAATSRPATITIIP